MVDVRSIAADFGVLLEDSAVAALEEQALVHAHRVHGCCDIDGRNDDWRIWIKSRLNDWGLLWNGPSLERERRLWVLLHVFPIYRERVRLPGDDKILFPSQIARSDIVTGHRIPRPIDRVAWRVAPGAPPTLDEVLGDT